MGNLSGRRAGLQTTTASQLPPASDRVGAWTSAEGDRTPVGLDQGRDPGVVDDPPSRMRSSRTPDSGWWLWYQRKFPSP